MKFVPGLCINADENSLFIPEISILPMIISYTIFAQDPDFFTGPANVETFNWLSTLPSNSTTLTLGTLAVFLPDDREPTIGELEDACWKSAYLLMKIAENNYTELYEYLNYIGKDPRKIIDETNDAFKRAEALGKSNTEDVDFGINIPPDDRLMKFLGFFVNKIREGYGKLKKGDYVGGTKDILIGTSGINIVVGGYALYEGWPDWLWPKGDYYPRSALP